MCNACERGTTSNSWTQTKTHTQWVWKSPEVIPRESRISHSVTDAFPHLPGEVRDEAVRQWQVPEAGNCVPRHVQRVELNVCKIVQHVRVQSKRRDLVPTDLQ